MFQNLRSLCAAAFVAVLATSAFAQSPPSGIAVGFWTPTTNHPALGGAVAPILLTDGSVVVHDVNNFSSPYPMTNHWWKLTPDLNGSYINGSWTQIADTPVNYGPLFDASAVLPDGRLIVEGGEYNLNVNNWTNLGAIYDPVLNTWTPVSAPPGWANIGDGQCCVLPDGTFMLANSISGAFQGFPAEAAILDPTTMVWTPVSLGSKENDYDEEGFTLLPDGTILTVDVVSTPNAEKYDIATGQWLPASQTPAPFTSSALGYEMGPGVLRFDGTVMQFGANSNTAIYTPPANPTDPGTWAAGPTLPNSNGVADGPACLLPSGNILFAASPVNVKIFANPVNFFETDGTGMAPVPATPNAAGTSSFNINMLVLPNGQVLETDSSPDVEIYTPNGSPQTAWRPTITNVASKVAPGSDYLITGTQFNGLSQTNAYGDDCTNASNYPLVRITNNSTHHVFYCRTHDHSTMAVATGSATVSTHFTVPAGIELGASTIEVVANGIPSTAQAITVGTNTPPVANAGPDQTIEATGPTTQFTLDGTGSSDADNDPLTYTWFDSSNTQVGTGSTLQLSRGLGIYTFTLQVSDGIDTRSDSVQITIQDTTPPAFGTFPDITVTANSNSGTVVTYGPFYATDLVDGSILATASPVSGTAFAPGSTLVTLTATDNSSNTGHAYFHVIVTYTWSGFLSPFPKQQYKMGSNIPIKFALTGASAGITNLVATGYWNTGGPNHPIGTFAYNPSTGQYQLNWKTTGLPKGTYTIVAVFDDGTSHTIQVILK